MLTAPHFVNRDRLFRKPFILSFLLVSLQLSIATPVAASEADDALSKIAADYIDDLPRFSAIAATAIGDHRADDRIDDVSASGRARHLKLLQRYRKRLQAVAWDDLSRENQVDAALIGNRIDLDIFSIERSQEWAWDPLYYVDKSGSAIYNLVARDFAPIDVRLRNAASRMRQLPKFLERARSELQPERVPKINAETAITQNQGVLAIIETMIVPELTALSESDREAVTAAIEMATEALTIHQNWLEHELLPRANGNFRIGAALFDEKLRYTLNSNLSRKEILARAEDEYSAIRNQMYGIAKDVYAGMHPYSSFPDLPDDAFKQVIIRAALEQAYQQLPEPDGIVEIVKQYMQQATDFVIEKNIVTMPDDPVEVIVMPEFQRGVTLAYLDPASPLDEGAKTFYAVAPLPGNWTPEQSRSFLREYNLLSIQNLTIHEGVPGHYLQLALSKRHPSVLRSVLWSGSFVEGWAVYAERVMIDEGYMDYDPLMRLINLKWYLRAVTNAIIDQAIHVDNMSRDAAMKLMIEGGFQEEREAAGKWVRAQLSSTQLSTYFVGAQEHFDMRRAVEKAWGAEFTLRRYHDQALSYGSPPVKYVKALMLGEPIPAGR